MTAAKIRQLRALAASTTFPHERESANRMADKLEAKMKAEQPQPKAAPRPPPRNPWDINNHMRARRTAPSSTFTGGAQDRHGTTAMDEAKRQARLYRQYVAEARKVIAGQAEFHGLDDAMLEHLAHEAATEIMRMRHGTS